MVAVPPNERGRPALAHHAVARCEQRFRAKLPAELSEKLKVRAFPLRVLKLDRSDRDEVNLVMKFRQRPQAHAQFILVVGGSPEFKPRKALAELDHRPPGSIQKVAEAGERVSARDPSRARKAREVMLNAPHLSASVTRAHPKGVCNEQSRRADLKLRRGSHVVSVAPGWLCIRGLLGDQHSVYHSRCQYAVRVKCDALDAARRLSASGHAWCWLDGEAAGESEQRVSYLGIASEVRIAERGHEVEFLAGLRVSAGAGGPVPAETPTEARFETGWVAALSYELGVALLGLDPHPDDVAPGFALRLDAVLAIDHDTGEERITGDPAAARVLRDVLDGPNHDASGPRAGATRHATSAEPAWRSSEGEYVRQVEECREAIHRGDAYVLCLTDTAELPVTRPDPLAIYERLRVAGSARRGAVIATPDRALVSASPERFLSVRGRTVETHPIKGTRPRGSTPLLDVQYAQQLAADPKERAENLMIVDLMRNDLSRVCAGGTVRVSRFLAVETHPHVHQLVSTVAGQLRAECDVIDALRACFPGGSMTGAPKHSAVSILSGLEAGPRGLYSGCFGWIDDRGGAELAMTIRGVELRDLRGETARALVGAGGGITADSDAARELAEKELKASAIFAVLRAEGASEPR